MLDHIVLTVSDTDRSTSFYRAALAPLGITHGVHYEGPYGHADLIGFGSNRALYFWLKQGVPHPQAIHFAFRPKAPKRCGHFTRRPWRLAAATMARRDRAINTIRAITLPMCSIPMAIRWL